MTPVKSGAPFFSTLTVVEADALPERAAGQTGWRLPTHIELLSLLDLGRTGPAINVAAFPGTPAEEFWSASLVVGSATYAWSVGFDTGGTGGTTRASGSNRVRCVRSGRSAPSEHYTSSTDTVRDNASGLVWQRAGPTETYSGADARSYCQGLSLAGFSSGWRLPSLKELETLVDVRSYAPAIDGTAFPNTPASGPSANGFWSSSLTASLSTFAWGVAFDYGYDYSYNLDPYNVYRVRCVR